MQVKTLKEFKGLIKKVSNKNILIDLVAFDVTGSVGKYFVDALDAESVEKALYSEILSRMKK